MERIVIVHWNKSTGPEPIIQFPPEKAFPPKDLILKIWSLHELDKGSSIIEYVPEDLDNRFISISQEFEGELYFLIIVYGQESNIENILIDYPDILAIIGKNLIELINTNKIPRAISESFNTLKNYTKLDKEENLLTFFQDKIKYTILKIFQNGVILKTELNRILRQEYGFSTINIDLLLISFIRENFIIKNSIPGSKDCYFMIKDLSCIRIPPKIIPELENQITMEVLEDYKKHLISFFLNYDYISEIENKTILNYLMDRDIFTLLRTLREKKMISGNLQTFFGLTSSGKKIAEEITKAFCQKKLL